MKHLNEIEKNPPIKTYLHYALPLSIICANGGYKENVYNMFIQLVYAPKDICPFDFHEFNYQALNYLCVEKYACFKCGFEVFINDIIKELTNGKYFIFWIDCFDIPNENNYQISHGFHGFLVYGFDDHENVFYGLGYRQSDSKYGGLIIPFEKLYNSVISKNSKYYQKVSIDGETYWPSFDIPMAEEKYRYYLKSSNYDLDDYKFHPKREIIKYGLEASKEFKNIVNTRIANMERIQPTDIGIFTEHKLFLCERTEKMVEPLENKKFLLEKMEYINNLKKETLSLKLLLLRYNKSLSMGKLDLERINLHRMAVIDDKIDKIHQLEISIMNIVTNIKDWTCVKTLKTYK